MGKYLDKFKAEQEAKKLLQETKSKTISDEEYWKEYTPEKENLEEDEYGDINEEYSSLHNHEINIDVAIKFSNIDGVIFESKEKNINCNVLDLDKFFTRLKKQIRLLDESKCDGKGGL